MKNIRHRALISIMSSLRITHLHTYFSIRSISQVISIRIVSYKVQRKKEIHTREFTAPSHQPGTCATINSLPYSQQTSQATHTRLLKYSKRFLSTRKKKLKYSLPKGARMTRALRSLNVCEIFFEYHIFSHKIKRIG